MSSQGKRTLLAVAALTTIAAGAVGCSPGGADDGSLTVAGPVPIESLDPHGALSMDAGTQLAARAIFSPLVRVTGPGEYVGELAEEWSANEDASEWTFELRDVTYSDGDSVTAHDVVASFERVLEEQGPLAGNFADYTAAASDDATVVFTSPAPDAAFLGKISSFFVAPSETDFSEPVGSGPYVVESFDAGQSLELAPNADYWGGAPELGTLTFQSIPEVASRLTALQTGEVDITWSMPDDQIGELKGNSDLTIETVPGDGVVTMWFNSSTPALEDAEVRRALWQGVNVEENVVALFPETGSPADSPVSPSVFGYSPQAPYEYDPDAAKAALDAAGFDYDTTIRLQYSQPQFAAFTQAVASDLAEIGVTVEPLEEGAGRVRGGSARAGLGHEHPAARFAGFRRGDQPRPAVHLRGEPHGVLQRGARHASRRGRWNERPGGPRGRLRRRDRDHLVGRGGDVSDVRGDPLRLPQHRRGVRP